MDTATRVVDLAERLLGKTALKIISIALVLTVINGIGNKLTD